MPSQSIEVTDELVERMSEAYDNYRDKINWQPMWDEMPDSYQDLCRTRMRAALTKVLR